MLVYTVTRQNAALSTSADLLTLTAGLGRSLVIVEIDVEGDGATSSYNELNFARVSAVATGAPTAA